MKYGEGNSRKIYGTGAWQVGELKDTSVYVKSYQMGKNI